MAALFEDQQRLAPPRVVHTELGDGAFVLKSPEPLGAVARCIGDWVEGWARETPHQVAFKERTPDGGWRELSYGELRQAIGAIAQSLHDLALPRNRPVVVLSDNAIDHALLMLAAMHIGVPVCTVSSAYSRLTKDFGKVKGILAALRPSLVYASDAATYGKAVAACDASVPVVFSQGAEAFPGAIRFADLLRAKESASVDAAFRSITTHDHAKYLLTSGSTGTPKVVINTHRMLCANQQMMAQVWRFLEQERPVIVDWLPWSHTFGGNHNLNMVLRNGGTLVIDEGRPVPGLIEKSVRNLQDIQPNLYFNVPRGFDMLLPFLEQDEALARAVLGRMKLAFYAAAALPQSTWERMQKVADRVRGEPLWLTTSWGATETAPAITSAHWHIERAGVIGLPLPGMELKFVPSGSKLEMRVRGVSVFPGYRDDPEQTAKAFDADGFYCIGDAGKLVDPGRPEQGVVFDGRVAEDFKLSSGTWVSVGTLRVKAVSALAPYAQDVVVTGHDRDELGLLVFPSPQGRALSAAELGTAVRSGLAKLKAEGGGSSQCPARALVLIEPPDVDSGEITDKGYINQRAVLTRRVAEVEALYSGADSRPITLD